MDANIRRHNLAAKLIRHHVEHIPEISEALSHRANSLQEGSQKYQQKKVKLKKKGKDSYKDFLLNYHHENHIYLNFIDDAKDYQQIIDKNTKYLAKHNSKHSGSDPQRSTSKH